MIRLWKPSRGTTPTPIPPVDIDANTKIFIYFDSSGSMNNTLLPLQQMRDGNLKAALLPRYNNDEVLYNSMVQVVENSTEQTINMLNWLGGAEHGGNVISLIFQDEADDPYYSDTYEPREAQWDTDLLALRTRLGSFTHQYDGIVFQVKNPDYDSAKIFKGFLLTAKNGLGSYSALNGLADLENVNIMADVVEGVQYADDPNYYLDFILGGLNRTLNFATLSRDSDPIVMDITVSSSQTVTAPFSPEAEFYYGKINWGDGSGWLDIDTYNDLNATHTYTTGGNYNVSITGYIKGINTELNTSFRSIINNVVSWGTVELYELSFYGCTNLVSLPTGSLPTSYYLSYIFKSFYNCTSLTSIPAGFYDNSTDINKFGSTFYNCTSLTSIPAGLFDSCSQVEEFYAVFQGCTNLTSIPAGLFDNNLLADYFFRTFYNCTSLTSIPAGLFRYNMNARGFYYTFYNCVNLELNRNIFYADGEESTRFNYVPPYDFNFDHCFYRTSFSGVQGEAPELWNCTFGRGQTTTLTYGGAGNSLTSLSNYSSIPAAWL